MVRDTAVRGKLMNIGTKTYHCAGLKADSGEIRYSAPGMRLGKFARLLTTAILLAGLLFYSTSGARAEQTCKESIIPTTQSSDFTALDNGTVIDNTTGLMWGRCSLGQGWNGKTCRGDAALYTWEEALQTAALVEFAGYDDWRLPNKNELESIIEDSCFSPAVSAEIFPATPSAYFWSSSPYAAVAEGAWSIDFGYGTVNASIKSGAVHVRLVRDMD
jgi:hypothetical protein